MMITIIPEDNFVNLDGQQRQFDLSKFGIDTNYHAIHWDGENGFIETKNGSNIILSDVSDILKFQPIIDAHAAVLMKDAKDAQDSLTEYRTPINVWKRDMQATDADMPRWMEDHITDQHGGLTDNIFTQKKYNAKVLLRATKPK